MVKEQSISLSSWDIALLLGVGLAPIHGGAAASVVFLASLISMVLMAYRRCVNISPANWTLTAIFLLYFFYFFLNGAFVGGNLAVAFDSMRGNLPIIFVAILCLCMGHDRNKLTAFQVGHWAAIATLTTFILAIFLYGVRMNSNLLNESRLLNTWDEGGRLRLFSRNALMFGSMYTTLAFLSLLGYAKKSVLQKITAVSALVIGLTVVALWTQSRGALLTAFVLGGLAIWYVRPKLSKVLIALLGLAIIFTAVYFLSDSAASQINAATKRTYEGLMTAQGASQSPEASTSHRLLMYELGVKAIKDAPLFGYGFQNRFDAINSYFQSEPLFRYAHLHNTFISHTVAGGIIGCIVLLLYIFTPLVVESVIKPKSKDIRYLTWVIVIAISGIGMTTAVLGHFIHSSFFSTLILIHLVATLNGKNDFKLSKKQADENIGSSR